MNSASSVRTAAEVLRGGRMKGGIFRSHLAWVREHHPERIGEVWEQLPPAATAELSASILPSSWYPFEWLVGIDKAILASFGGQYRNVLKELGRYSARINLSTTYRLFDRETNHEFFRNSALLHSQFQDFGKASYEQTGESSGRMIHRDYACFSRIFCESALGYYEQVVENHGGKTPSVREVECQCYCEPTCTFDIAWE